MYKYIRYKGVVSDAKVQSIVIKKKKIFFYVVLVIVILSILLSYKNFYYDIAKALESHCNHFVRKFEVQITSNLTQENDIELLKKYINADAKYIWQLSPWQIREDLLQWRQIKEVSVKLSLPSHLYIKIIKRKPYAVWSNYKDFFLVDIEGSIIDERVTNEDKKNYIVVIGQDAPQNLYKIMHVLEKYSRQNGKIASLRFVGQRRWDVTLNTGIIVKLPEKNLLLAIKLLDEIIERTTIQKIIGLGSTIDMRLSSEKIFITTTK
jgi:cell division protein FtsQ